MVLALIGSERLIGSTRRGFNMLRIYTAASNSAHALLNSYRTQLSDKGGVTAIEYGLIAGGIAVGIIVLVVTVGGDLKNVFTTISGKVATIPK